MAKAKPQAKGHGDLFLVERAPESVPLHVVTEKTYARWLASQDAATRGWLDTQRYQQIGRAHV